jgi:striatin 1/3/4
LQEITYLTSPGALNPLPPRAQLTDLEQQVGDEAENAAAAPPPEPERPIKALPDRAIPARTYGEAPTSDDKGSSSTSADIVPNGVAEVPRAEPSSSVNVPVPSLPSSSALAIQSTARPPSSPAVHTKSLPDDDQPVQGQEPQQLLTAIYRPESKSAWKEELRAANESAAKVSLD